MPNPAIIPAVISGSASLLGQGINAYATGKTNRQSRAFAREMYDRQRQNAMDDWYMQNEYNHPSSQMARLRAAGLNPNLVYGNGAPNQGGSVRSTDTPSWNPKAPQFDLGSVSGAYFDTQVKQAQIDNLREQNTVLAQERVLKAAQVISTLASADKTQVDTKTGEFDLGLKQELKETSVEIAKAGLRKTGAETDVMLQRNEREAVMQSQTIKESIQRILQMRAATALTQEQTRTEPARRGQIHHQILQIEKQVELMDKDLRLRQLDIELKNLGLQPSDELWQRVVARILNNIIGNDKISKLLNSAD